MHSLNYAPGSFGGGRREEGRSALQPLGVQGQLCLGSWDLLPCPGKRRYLLGPRTTYRSHPEEKGVQSASGKHHICQAYGQVLGPRTCPSGQPPCCQDQKTNLTLEVLLYSPPACLGPELRTLQAGLRSGGARGLGQVWKRDWEGPGRVTVGEALERGVFLPPWV